MRAFERRYAIRPISAMDSLHRTLLESLRPVGRPWHAAGGDRGLGGPAHRQRVRAVAAVLRAPGPPYHDRGSAALNFQWRAALSPEGRPLIWSTAGCSPTSCWPASTRRRPWSRRMRPALSAWSTRFRCKLFHKKAIFAVLSDDANAHLFSAAEREADPPPHPLDAQGARRATPPMMAQRVDLAELCPGPARAAGAQAKRRLRRQGRGAGLGGGRRDLGGGVGHGAGGFLRGAGAGADRAMPLSGLPGRRGAHRWS